MLSARLQQEAMEEEEVELEEYNALGDSGLPTQHGKTQVPNSPASPDTLYETDVPADSANTDKSDMKGSADQTKASDQDANQTPDNDTASVQTQNSPLTPSNTDHSDMKGSSDQTKASDQDTNQTPDNDTGTELTLESLEEDAELNEIITELEGELYEDDEMGDEMGDEEIAVDDMESDMDDVEDAGDEIDTELAISDDEVEGEESADISVDDVADDEGEEDEEIDLEEILREMSLGEEDPAMETDPAPGFEDLQEQIADLQKENAEYKKAFGYLRGKLNEVNLLNAKLLYTNKVFKNVALNESQKMRVVEAFDRTRNVREVKLTYVNLQESFKLANSGKKRTLAEGVASQAVKSTAPSAKAVTKQKQILAEGNEMAARMQKLAGIKKS
jgi:hypothetical protein